jgi:hypothetical protein
VSKVLQRLTDNGLRVNLDKSQFMLKQFVGLGKRVTPQGIEVDPAKTESILSIPQPSTYADLHSFLGMTNYIRDHIPQYQNYDAPLRALLSQERRTPKQKPSKRFGPLWTPATTTAFQQLRLAVANSLTNRYFDWTRPISIMIDASTHGHGSALFQENFPGEGLTPHNLVTFRAHSSHRTHTHVQSTQNERSSRELDRHSRSIRHHHQTR